MTLKPVKGLTYIVFIFVLTQLTKLVYNKSIGEHISTTTITSVDHGMQEGCYVRTLRSQ